MSRTLGIDTTGPRGGVALLSGTTLEAARDLGAPGEQAERILVELDALLHDLSLSPRNVDRIAVATGPGSFTGVRIGMAAAQGLGFSLGIPVTGVTSLEILAAWALEVTEGECPVLVPLIDARRGQVYAAVYTAEAGDLVERAAPAALAPADVTAFVEAALAVAPVPPARIAFCGDGVPVAAPELAAWGTPFRSVFPPRAADRGRVTAALGVRRFAADRPAAAPTPLYIREADARKPARPPGGAAGLFPGEGPAEGGDAP